MRVRLLPLSLALFLVAALGGTLLIRRAADVSSPREPSEGEIRSTLEGLPLSFIENRGQVDPRAHYYLHGAETSVWFTPSGLRMRLVDPQEGGWNLALDFVGARAAPVGLGRTPAQVSYFKGDPDDWHTGLPTSSGVAYRDLWPGIDLTWSGTGSRLKYSFVVSPGADPSQVRMRWRGATRVAVGGDGTLDVSTPVRSLSDEAPMSFQGAAGARREIDTSYDLDGSTYGFELGAYDPDQRLVIDPAILVYAGYIGGSDFDVGQGVAVDSAGAAYVTGYTASTQASFPLAVGPDLTYNGGTFDAFVAKVAPSGASLSYIGGSGDDRGRNVAVDGAGSAYVTGSTTSTEATFPVAGGPDLTHNGGGDAFAAKVAPSGASLSYAGYIGGSGEESGFGVAVDPAGAAYVGGYTDSTEATFPVAGGPDLTYNGGLADAFVAKVPPSGASLSYAGYIGGSGDDYGRDLAVDGAGVAYLAGETGSTEATFPVVEGPDLTHNGGSDAFVAKVPPSAASLSYAGYIGGSGDDTSYGVAVDPAGAAYVGGYTNSTEATFPVAVGPDLSQNGGTDAFVAKVPPSGASLSYAGYIGGSGVDGGYAVAVDSAGAAYVTGDTTSTEATFPAAVGPDLTHNGGYDGFMAKVGFTSTLAVTKDGTGAGTVTSSPAGIDCGPDCSEAYPHGTAVTLTAEPPSNSTFAGWSGGGCSGTGACTVSMDSDKTVTATFNLTPTPPAPPPPTPQPKSVSLKADPKKVEEGEKTKLTAVVAPCAGHEGDLIQFYRGSKKIASKVSDGTCTAQLKVKMKKGATFTADSPQQDQDHLAGTSKTIRVKVR